MIRLRKKDQSSYDVPLDKVPFVEIVNDFSGEVGLLIVQPEPGVILLVHPNSEDAARYEALMHAKGVKFTSKVIHRKPL